MAAALCVFSEAVLGNWEPWELVTVLRLARRKNLSGVDEKIQLSISETAPRAHD